MASYIQECFPTKEDRGESVQPASRIVQDLNDVDVIQASDRVQQWEEEQRLLLTFKQSLIDAVYVLLCVGEFGPIPIANIHEQWDGGSLENGQPSCSGRHSGPQVWF